MKVCGKCHVMKELDAFSLSNKSKDKKQYYCKLCNGGGKYNANKRDYTREYQRNRYATDPAFRMLGLSRTRLKAAIRGKGIKPAKTMELVGCTAEELIGYLQELIPEGADLKKYHIDHIRPCASFDFSDPEEIRKCFHYTNLQPLTPQANRKKGAKYFPTHQ